MEFPNSYFEDEVRCGFPVPTMIKRGWAAGLVVLEDIDRICKKHGITYYADWGTLLGAVRHNGYVPWDDDLDLCMKRADYEHFLKVAQKELPQNYKIHNIYTDDKFSATLTCILNCDNYCIDSDFLEKYQGCTAAIGVDIIALDYYPKDKKQQEEIKESLDFVVSLIAQYDDLPEDEKKEQLKLVEYALGVKIKPGVKSVTFQLGQLLEEMCKLYSEKECDELCNMICIERGSPFHFPKVWFDKSVEIDFENIKMPLPSYYEDYLRLLYGDYTKLIKSGSTHEYPYFGQHYKQGYAALGGVDFIPTSMPVPRKWRAGTIDNTEAEKPIMLFLPAQEKHWKELEPIYKKYSEDERFDVFIMPIPYYVKDYMGNALEMKYEGNEFPSDLPLIDFNDYDLNELKPDVLVFQIPWDEWHEVIQVPDEYCSETLRKASKQLIYVPINQPNYFENSESRTAMMLKKSMEYPGVLNADKIEVLDEKLRENYLEALVSYTGEATRSVWAEKLSTGDR